MSEARPEFERSGTRDCERAIAVFTFLKEFTELRSRTVRSYEEYEKILWFAAVPREPECACAAWERGLEREDADVWLEIRQPRLVRAPQPSSDLQLWLNQDQVGDSSLDMPELRDEISIARTLENGEEEFVRERLEDRPEIRSAWDDYVTNRWWPWAESDRRAQRVQTVYTQLFSIYQMQQRLGEQYEVVLGLGLLVWRTPDDQPIRRHLLVGAANVAFDSKRAVMTIGPAGEGARLRLEQDMLDPKYRPDAQQLTALEMQVSETAEQVWTTVSIDDILAGWVHSVSAKGVYRVSIGVEI